MNRARLAAVLICSLGLAASCDGFESKGTSPSPQAGDSDTDADADSDTDADADSDTDTDTDTDTDELADDRTVSGTTLCAGGGTASSGTHIAVTCIGPAEVALTTTASDGTHTLLAGAIRRVSP